MSFEVKLLTPRVTATESQAYGEKITVENDECWYMLQNGTAELVGKKQPSKPKRVVEMEKAEAAKQADSEDAAGEEAGE